ncbi:MAG: hypothetical protein OEW77_09075 [Gemmatimonadota bacterium]|nr:hypothetical protein [Gemmatimonadota bacterium]
MMDVMVQWEESATTAEKSIARVCSVASPDTLEHPSRDVVTLYGVPTPESLALALATAVEARRAGNGASGVLRELHVSETTGASGDTRWRDHGTGELIRQDLTIPLTVLRETAGELLAEGGQAIRRLLAGLLMKDWPAGTRRALTYQLSTGTLGRSSDTLARQREADAANFDEYEAA